MHDGRLSNSQRRDDEGDAMTLTRPMPAIDYRRLDMQYHLHHLRYQRFVESHGLTCQDCHGEGQYIAEYLDGWPRYELCDWCEGTGRMTPHKRGVWLTLKRQAAVNAVWPRKETL